MGFLIKLNDYVEIETSTGSQVGQVKGINICYYNDSGIKLDVMCGGKWALNVEPKMVRVITKKD